MKEADMNKADTTAVLTFPTADRKPEQLMVINDPPPLLVCEQGRLLCLDLTPISHHHPPPN